MAKKKTTPKPYAKPDNVQYRGNEVFCPLRGKWLKANPEERVRQEFIKHLRDHYGYTFEQMAQEQKTQHGRRSPKADIVIYPSPEAKAAGKSPLLVVECKAETVDIHPRDYYQGESYARAVACEIFVMHNARQTAVFKLVPGTPGESIQINELPAAADWTDAKRIEAIKNSTRAFSRKEFQDLLFKCHSILRDVHKMEPGRAFDAISKVLFIKMYIERTGKWGTFTTEFLDQRRAVRLPSDPLVHDQLFDQTRKHYETDEIFAAADTLEISGETFDRLVKELARFNLSATSDDVKGLAFERFLGATFRGELGQFFTPRPIVDFMVDLLDPQEKELICDPAAGSGGFLIKAFEHVRRRITDDVQAQKDGARAKIEAKKLKEDDETKRIEDAFAKFNTELDPDQDDPPSRVRVLARSCIFGTDAEPRAARTAKMNMIMHGDGHGGIHYHDGLVDINGVFPGRFDIVLTNPPFGQNVGEDQKFGSSEQTRVAKDAAYVRRCRDRYGDAWEDSHGQIVKLAEENAKILDSFEIGKDKPNRPTELLFLERCLQLIHPGGRMGIVLPDGNLNNPSLAWLRRWAEGKARLLAVVSLPQETFVSSNATVKASLVFLRKFTTEDSEPWDNVWAQAHAKHDAEFDQQRSALRTEYGPRIASADTVAIAAILKKLEACGVVRALPDWQRAAPPPYPRGIGQTTIGKPRWNGKAKDAKQGRALRKQFDAAWDEAATAKADGLHKEMRAKLRKLDIAHSVALWQTVRELFDYPVFTAAPETVGITSTGADGPSQLPEVLDAYHKYQAWVDAGADTNNIPSLTT
ncbi:MAG: N-6 DNA methylase [Planctomycetes bacterium]|nr:N-6 DNA methylase [Planctomycetota bacterium]